MRKRVSNIYVSIRGFRELSKNSLRDSRSRGACKTTANTHSFTDLVENSWLNQEYWTKITKGNESDRYSWTHVTRETSDERTNMVMKREWKTETRPSSKFCFENNCIGLFHIKFSSLNLPKGVNPCWIHTGKIVRCNTYSLWSSSHRWYHISVRMGSHSHPNTS